MIAVGFQKDPVTEEKVPLGVVAVLDKLSVVFVILLAALFLGEALTLRSIAGVVLTVAGTLLILFK